MSAAERLDRQGVAPVLTPSQARHLMCPLLSTLRPDNTLERVPCQAGACLLWDWLIKPGPTRDGSNEGVGKCSIPRRVYQTAHKFSGKAKAGRAVAR
jgi:hypothetical protein